MFNPEEYKDQQIPEWRRAFVRLHEHTRIIESIRSLSPHLLKSNNGLSTSSSECSFCTESDTSSHADHVHETLLSDQFSRLFRENYQANPESLAPDALTTNRINKLSKKGALKSKAIPKPAKVDISSPSNSDSVPLTKRRLLRPTSTTALPLAREKKAFSFSKANDDDRSELPSLPAPSTTLVSNANSRHRTQPLPSFIDFDTPPAVSTLYPRATTQNPRSVANTTSPLLSPSTMGTHATNTISTGASTATVSSSSSHLVPNPPTTNAPFFPPLNSTITDTSLSMLPRRSPFPPQSQQPFFTSSLPPPPTSSSLGDDIPHTSLTLDTDVANSSAHVRGLPTTIPSASALSSAAGPVTSGASLVPVHNATSGETMVSPTTTVTSPNGNAILAPSGPAMLSPTAASILSPTGSMLLSPNGTSILSPTATDTLPAFARMSSYNAFVLPALQKSLRNTHSNNSSGSDGAGLGTGKARASSTSPLIIPKKTHTSGANINTTNNLNTNVSSTTAAINATANVAAAVAANANTVKILIMAPKADKTVVKREEKIRLETTNMNVCCDDNTGHDDNMALVDYVDVNHDDNRDKCCDGTGVAGVCSGDAYCECPTCSLFSPELLLLEAAYADVFTEDVETMHSLYHTEMARVKEELWSLLNDCDLYLLTKRNKKHPSLVYSRNSSGRVSVNAISTISRLPTISDTPIVSSQVAPSKKNGAHSSLVVTDQMHLLKTQKSVDYGSLTSSKADGYAHTDTNSPSHMGMAKSSVIPTGISNSLSLSSGIATGTGLGYRDEYGMRTNTIHITASGTASVTVSPSQQQRYISHSSAEDKERGNRNMRESNEDEEKQVEMMNLWNDTFRLNDGNSGKTQNSGNIDSFSRSSTPNHGSSPIDTYDDEHNDDNEDEEEYLSRRSSLIEIAQHSPLLASIAVDNRNSRVDNRKNHDDNNNNSSTSLFSRLFGSLRITSSSSISTVPTHDSLRARILALYTSLRKLHDYTEMCLAALDHSLSEHDAVSPVKLSSSLLPLYDDQYPLHWCSEGISCLHIAYSRVCEVSVSAASQHLHDSYKPPSQAAQWAKLGFTLGLCLCVSVLVVVMGIIVPDTLSFTFFTASMPLFRLVVVAVSYLALWGFVVWICRQRHIDHVSLLHLSPTHALTPVQIWQVASSVLLVSLTTGLLCSLLYLHQWIVSADSIADAIEEGEVISQVPVVSNLPTYIHTSVFIGFIIACLYPGQKFRFHSRYYLFSTLKAVVLAPWYAISFEATFIGDQLCSLTKMLFDIAYAACFYLTGEFLDTTWRALGAIPAILTGNSKVAVHMVANMSLCRPAVKQAQWILAFLPFTFRAVQCICLYRREGLIKHLVNLCKYISAILMSLTAMLYKQRLDAYTSMKTAFEQYNSMAPGPVVDNNASVESASGSDDKSVSSTSSISSATLSTSSTSSSNTTTTASTSDMNEHIYDHVMTVPVLPVPYNAQNPNTNSQSGNSGDSDNSQLRAFSHGLFSLLAGPKARAEADRLVVADKYLQNAGVQSSIGVGSNAGDLGSEASASDGRVMHDNSDHIIDNNNHVTSNAHTYANTNTSANINGDTGINTLINDTSAFLSYEQLRLPTAHVSTDIQHTTTSTSGSTSGSTTDSSTAALWNGNMAYLTYLPILALTNANTSAISSSSLPSLSTPLATLPSTTDSSALLILREHAQWVDTLWALFVILALIASIFNCCWDLIMDWGFLETGPAFPFREHSTFPSHTRKLYFTSAMIVNIMLRFVWIETLIPSSMGVTILKSDMTVLYITLLEVLRRSIWNVIKLDNEHVLKQKSVPQLVYDDNDD